MTKIEYIRSIKVINREFVKKEEKDLKELYKYLESRDFPYYVPLVERNKEFNTYRYIEDTSIDDNQKGLDLADTLALLHNKTSFKKNISTNKNKEIYRKLKGYVKYLQNKYDNMMNELEYHEYPSPSEQLFLNNYSKLDTCLRFLDKEIDSWFNLVKDKKSERVSMIHGSPDLSHIVKNDKNYLLSWGKAHIETPILDIIHFYHKEWEHLEFKSILERYISKCEFLEHEKKLMFINLAMPIELIIGRNELENTLNVERFTHYIYKTEDLIRPYYTE